MPSRSTADELKQIMSVRPNNNNNERDDDDDDNKRHDPSPTSYPVFEPHITLASIHLETPVSLSMIRRNVLPQQRPFLVEFGSVDVGDHYFRSVYITVVLDETLKKLRRAVQETLDVYSNTPCYPHMSLVYITDEDQEVGRERERYFDELRGRKLISYDDGGGVKLRTPDLKSGWFKGSMMTEIWVTRSVGPVETWEVLDKIILSQS